MKRVFEVCENWYLLLRLPRRLPRCCWLHSARRPAAHHMPTCTDQAPPTEPSTHLPATPPPQEADEDGSGELDPDEFYEKLGPYLGQSLSQAEVGPAGPGAAGLGAATPGMQWCRAEGAVPRGRVKESRLRCNWQRRPATDGLLQSCHGSRRPLSQLAALAIAPTAAAGGPALHAHRRRLRRHHRLGGVCKLLLPAARSQRRRRRRRRLAPAPTGAGVQRLSMRLTWAACACCLCLALCCLPRLARCSACLPQPLPTNIPLPMIPPQQDHWRKEWRGARHKEPAERVYCCPAPLDSYITAGRGGQLRCG